MSFDVKAVADAIAVRFGPTIVTPPTSQDPIRYSTASLPDAITHEPAVHVFPPTISFGYGPSLRKAKAIYLVNFYLYMAPRDNPYNAELLNNWMTALYATLDNKAHLGLSANGVNTATMGDVNPGPLNYGGTDYHGLQWSVTVEMGEGLAANDAG